MAGYTELIPLVSDGQPVNAGHTNRPTRAIDGNVRYLKEIIESAVLGSTIFARDKTVEIDAKVGQPVYYNKTTQRFERGLAAVEVEETTGALITTRSTHVWGLIYRKQSATKADILLSGVANFDLSQAIDGDVEDGLYYLSGTSPGKLQKQHPPVGVRVCQVGQLQADGKYEVYVNTEFRDLLEEHRHYKFELQVVPAGDHTPPSPSNRHVITNADDSIEGWLPADHASFAGKAPPGAAFGYNLVESKINNLWPPLPLQSAYLELHRGEDKDQLGMSVPLGQTELALIDENGIWWMSDCYGDVPWPTDYDSANPTSVSESISVVECPRNLHMRMFLWFTRPTFQTTGSAVLSLRAVPDSGIIVRCYPTGEEDKTTGHLELALDLDLALGGEDNEPGYLAFKRLEGTKLHRGPVVESIKPGNDNVTITSDVDIGEDGKVYGNAVISVDTDLSNSEVPIETVRLDGVTEEYYEDYVALGFTAGRESEFRGRAHVPAKQALPSGTKLKLRFWLLGRTSGTIPDNILTLSYRRLSRPSALLTGTALNTTESNLALVAGLAITANQFYEVESAAFDILAGDELFFTLSRAADDGYGGDLFLLMQRGVIVLA